MIKKEAAPKNENVVILAIEGEYNRPGHDGAQNEKSHLAKCLLSGPSGRHLGTGKTYLKREALPLHHSSYFPNELFRVEWF